MPALKYQDQSRSSAMAPVTAYIVIAHYFVFSARMRRSSLSEHDFFWASKGAWPRTGIPPWVNI